MFPTTWRERAERAKRDAREGPNLVVYRTKSAKARDHYVVPNSVARELLVEDTLTTSRVDGTRRWNLTLKDGNLHISHRAGKVDVSDHHGARLLVEELDIDGLQEPTTDKMSGTATAVPDGESVERARPSGAGFGGSEQNREVEEAAVSLVSETYRREGWQVESVEQKRCGFDLRCTRNREEAHVEVKGVAGAERRFVITAGELRYAREDDRFVLALVTSALSSRPVPERLPAAKFRNAFTFDPVQYWAIPIENDGRSIEQPNRALLHLIIRR